MSGIYFAHPHSLLNTADEVRKEVGSEKFFSSSSEKVKKAREGFSAYFFTLVLKQWTKQDWWLAQYDQKIRSFPDFDFFAFSENSNDISLEPVELTEIYPHFESFEYALDVVNKKIEQYGNKPLNVSLLIFVNHEKSEEWIELLKEHLTTSHPFLSIWTSHLLFSKDLKKVRKVVGQKIGIDSKLRIEADLDNDDIHKRQPLPQHFYEIDHDGLMCVVPKPDYLKRIKKLISQKETS